MKAISHTDKNPQTFDSLGNVSFVKYQPIGGMSAVNNIIEVIV